MRCGAVPVGDGRDAIVWRSLLFCGSWEDGNSRILDTSRSLNRKLNFLLMPAPCVVRVLCVHNIQDIGDVNIRTICVLGRVPIFLDRIRFVNPGTKLKYTIPTGIRLIPFSFFSSFFYYI